MAKLKMKSIYISIVKIKKFLGKEFNNVVV